ncbi:MAG: hypothetical protein ACREL4_03600 [Gemmatimonadales bacterium]
MLLIATVLLATVQNVRQQASVLPAWAHFDSVTFQSPVPVDWHKVAGRSLGRFDVDHPDSGALKSTLSHYGPTSAVPFDDALPSGVPRRYYYVVGPAAWGVVVPTRIEGFILYDLADRGWAVESTSYHGFLSATLPADWPRNTSPAFVLWSSRPDTISIASGHMASGPATADRLPLTLSLRGREEHLDLWEFDSVPRRLYRPINSFGPPDRTWVVRSRSVGEFIMLEWGATDLCTAAFLAFSLEGGAHVLASSDAECAD